MPTNEFPQYINQELRLGQFVSKGIENGNLQIILISKWLANILLQSCKCSADPSIGTDEDNDCVGNEETLVVTTEYIFHFITVRYKHDIRSDHTRVTMCDTE